MRKQTVMKRRKGLNDTEVEGEAEGNRKKKRVMIGLYTCVNSVTVFTCGQLFQTSNFFFVPG